MSENSGRIINIPTGEHAEKRMQQRGIKPFIVNMIIQFADRKIHVGNDRISLSVSRKRAKQLRNNGQLAPKDAEKICDKSVLVSDDHNVVTTLHIDEGSKGRHYRKSVKKGRSRSKRHY